MLMTDRDDEIRELRRQLEAANEREKAAQEREEAARQREESLRRDQRNTSYHEYLRLCHEELFMTLTVQDKARSSSGGTTDVTGKYYPLTLRPWDGFLDGQRRCHTIIEETVPELLLPSRNDVRAVARASNKRPVASEEDLRTFEHLAIEDPVENVFAVFGPRSQTCPGGQELDCKAITFENHCLSLTEPDDTDSDDGDIDEIFVKPMHRQPGSKKRMALHRRIPRKRGPDKWAIRTTLAGEKYAAFPGEYKAAHKIPAESFQKAMCKEDLFTRVILKISSGKVSTDGETRLQEQMEETVAKALAQTFHYMIHLGSSCGYLTAGKALIFLHIEDDPTVLYHHISQPDIDAKGLDGTVDPFYTAVAQLAAFCLQTCREPGKSNLWKEKAILRLSKWPQPYTEMRGGTTEEESPQSIHSASSYAGSVTAAQKLTVQLRQRTRASCNPQQQPDADNDTSDEESAGGASRRSHGLQASLEAKAPGSNKRKDITSGSEEGPSNEELELESRPYCTQDCLLGLKRNQFLDEKCPNVALHRSITGSMAHPINAARLLDLLHKDLTPPVRRLCSIRPLDGCGKYGRTGALFKISSRRYGYTFVGKGTFAAAVGSLEHEEKVYRRMEPLQGHHVPVCLGSIALVTPFTLPAADIVHMLLMAWAGDAVTIKGNGLSEWLRFRQLLLTCGVIHNDMRQENLLWNSERGHLLLIDFDLATILPDMRQTQLKRLSKKRKRHLHDPVTIKYSTGSNWYQQLIT
ncbi:hypothetical protein FVEG_06982 [Fusarium verticillioides 7600]|uniref:Protein kinase domain-containing protein n=1 Tax=Gibberella moniliformis (strain M3125 / FGSC 7600) TaxID=334819 RepID=W7M680_GIBM7|nr:hypothetical protein FVEG_06982 [Fusarium verticillioides 7600]EWG46526.1 hypothetical protein FVEG_06982 [Fusarium verticillioides 7600]